MKEASAKRTGSGANKTGANKTGGLEASHAIRLSFEQAGTILVLAVLGFACAAALVACWPAAWADVLGEHVNKIAGSLLSFVGALGGVLGLSWGRGHLDARLDR